MLQIVESTMGFFVVQEGDVLFTPLYALYVFAAVGVFAFSLPRWTHLFASTRALFFRRIGVSSRLPQPGLIKVGSEPHVTIQICAYNEGSVVPATVARACSVDWPRDKLTVHICDDSTDKTSIFLIKQAVEYWRDKGIDVERLTRPDRVGYKAGNMRHNFGKIKGDYVAYFDADHHPERDFLRTTIPHFFNETGQSKHRVALVQTPWAYHNTHENILTESDSFSVDTYYYNDFGRSVQHKFFGFQGTGGVWRKQCVAEAGGFTWESVTEDIATSYKVYIHNKDCEFVYLPDSPQCLEVPSDILAHIQQRNRWTKGYVQIFWHYGWAMASSPKIPLLMKCEFFLHVLGSAEFSLFAMLSILNHHLRLSEDCMAASWLFKAMAQGSVALVYVLSILFCVFTKTSGSNGHYSSFLSRLSRLIIFIPSSILDLGRLGFEIKAAFEGTFSSDRTFLTTPKNGAPTKANRNFGDDLVASLALLLAFYQMAAVYVNNPYEHMNGLGMYVGAFWHIVFVLGQICVPGAFFWAKYNRVAMKWLATL